MKKDRQGKGSDPRRCLLLVLAGGLGITPTACAPGPLETGSGARPADFFAPIRTIDLEDTDFSDLEGLGKALAGVEVVLLGEPIHGSNTGVSARARLVRFLHSRMGFSILAYEASFYGAARAWDDAQLAPVRQLTLSLDVAQTPEAAEPFAAWQQAIRALAEDMDAAAVDDQGRPVTLMHYTTIADELKTLYRALESRDMAAGSALARRLFQ